MKTYKTFSVELAKKAGEIIREHFSLGMEKEWKGNNTPLTIADTKVNKMVIAAIRESFSGHSIVAEEENSLTNHEYVWVCDPIDGTLAFSHGIPIATFSLALTKNGVPILGVVYDPFMDRLFFAEKGKGAFLNDKEIHVSTKNTLTKAVIDVEGFRTTLHNFDTVRTEMSQKNVVIMMLRSTNYAGMLLATGTIDGLLFPYDTVWDVAAIKIIVEEAGGIATDVTGNEQRYDKPINGFIASNKALHPQLLDMAKKFAIKTIH